MSTNKYRGSDGLCCVSLAQITVSQSGLCANWPCPVVVGNRAMLWGVSVTPALGHGHLGPGGRGHREGGVGDSAARRGGGGGGVSSTGRWSETRGTRRLRFSADVSILDAAQIRSNGFIWLQSPPRSCGRFGGCSSLLCVA